MKMFLLPAVLALAMSVSMNSPPNTDNHLKKANTATTVSINTAIDDASDYLPGYVKTPAIVGAAPAVPVLRPIGLYVPTVRTGQMIAMSTNGPTATHTANRSTFAAAGLLCVKDVTHVGEVAHPWKHLQHAAGPDVVNTLDHSNVSVSGNIA